MQIVKILESAPAIEIKYLKYLEDEGFTLAQFDEKVDVFLVKALVIRNQVVVNEKLLEKYPNVRYILRVGVGLDAVDLALCEERNIQVQNTPGANANAVADMAIWGLLTLLRGAKKLIKDGLEGQFAERFSYEGFECSSQHIIIVGFGKIGKKFYKRCLSFGVKRFSVIDPFLMKNEIESFEYCTKYENVGDIIANADILSLFVPLNNMTKDLITVEVFDQAKSTLKILNLGRGGVVNENDLYDFLLRYSQASAYLDVWEGDPELTESIRMLMQLGNCIITPHIGTMTEEAKQAMHRFSI